MGKFSKSLFIFCIGFAFTVGAQFMWSFESVMMGAFGFIFVYGLAGMALHGLKLNRIGEKVAFLLPLFGVHLYGVLNNSSLFPLMVPCVTLLGVASFEFVGRFYPKTPGKLLFACCFFLSGALLSLGFGFLSLKERNGKPGTNLVLSEVVLKNKHSQEIRLDLFQGKALIIEIWSTECAACIRQMPYFERIFQRLKNNDEIEVLLVNCGRMDSFEDFVNQSFTSKFETPSYYDVNSRLIEMLTEKGVPQTLFIAKDGTLTQVHLGFNPIDDPFWYELYWWPKIEELGQELQKDPPKKEPKEETVAPRFS